jgi:hypothetical protein
MSENRLQIELKRSPEGQLKSVPLEQSGVAALSNIEGVSDVGVVNSSNEKITLSYTWSGTEMFNTTDEHLSKWGLQRADWKQP